jgi:pimeloyl-ACP methyl ester carboxylesterase
MALRSTSVYVVRGKTLLAIGSNNNAFVSFQHVRVLVLLAVVFSGLSCTNEPSPVNSSFRISRSKAAVAMREIGRKRKPLKRPLVIIGGYLDFFHFNANLTTSRLGRTFADDRVITLAVDAGNSFQDLRQNLIAAVDKAFPTCDPNFTTEVDVVGHSLGGLVARYAAAPSDTPARGRRLKIARLFTISSPHTGSAFAAYGITRFQHDLSPGSSFLAYVAGHDASATYSLFPYVLLGDNFVGQRHTAPPGQNPLWLAGPMFFTHFNAMSDRRILADIALRLRDEEPISHMPASPLPEK